jgi:hypothetical protein
MFHWWKGGGEGSCHSSVVAPSPHGLALATRFFWKAQHAVEEDGDADGRNMGEP